MSEKKIEIKITQINVKLFFFFFIIVSKSVLWALEKWRFQHQIKNAYIFGALSWCNHPIRQNVEFSESNDI